MAWVAEENFNSYADDTDLAGQTGGSGWLAGWVNGAVNQVFSETGTKYEGAASARAVSGGGNTFYTRALTSAISDSGVCYVAMMNTANNSGNNAFSLRSVGGNRVGIVLDSDGNLKAQGNTIQAYSASTWYIVRMTFSVTAGNYTVAVSNNGAAYGSESSTITMGSTGNISLVGIGGDTGSGISYVDLITATDPVVTTSIHNLLLLGIGN